MKKGQGTKKTAAIGGRGPEKFPKKPSGAYYFNQGPKKSTKSTRRKS